MNKFKQASVALATAGLLASGVAQAALTVVQPNNTIDGTIYDTVLNISWLPDANYAKTSGYDSDGLMTWAAANSWIASLNTSAYLGYTNWRLPTALNQDGSGPCSLYGCTNSEMGHMYYNNMGAIKPYYVSPETLAPPAGQDTGILNGTNTDRFTLFNDTIQSGFYWSATEQDSDQAWGFYFEDGYQDYLYKDEEHYAWAVRAPIPEPETYAMLLAGLGMLGFVARRRKQKSMA